MLIPEIITALADRRPQCCLLCYNNVSNEPQNQISPPKQHCGDAESRAQAEHWPLPAPGGKPRPPRPLPRMPRSGPNPRPRPRMLPEFMSDGTGLFGGGPSAQHDSNRPWGFIHKTQQSLLTQLHHHQNRANMAASHYIVKVLWTAAVHV